MSEISMRDGGERDVLVELSGEFDQHDLQNLSDALGGAVSSGRVAVVDLSGVTFLDVGTTRELAVRSQLHARQMTLHSPSTAVHASVAACGLESWFDFRVRTRAIDGAALPGTHSGSRKVPSASRVSPTDAGVLQGGVRLPAEGLPAR